MDRDENQTFHLFDRPSSLMGVSTVLRAGQYQSPAVRTVNIDLRDIDRLDDADVDVLRGLVLMSGDNHRRVRFVEVRPASAVRLHVAGLGHHIAEPDGGRRAA